MTLCFTFDPKRYRQLQSNIPRVTFTCVAIAKDSLPPYLRHCYKFYEYLENYRNGDDNTIQFIEIPSDDFAPNYSQCVKNPVALSTIREKIMNQKYLDMKEFKADVDLMWENCRRYNKPEDPIVNLANRIEAAFNNVWKMHTSIEDIDGARKAAQSLENTKKELLEITKKIQATYVFPERITQKKGSSHDQSSRSKSHSHERSIDRKPTLQEPSEELLNTEMSTEQKYRLAEKIDTMPIELLGGVLDILKKYEPGLGISPDEDKIIPFSDISVQTLRRIEAYVNEMSENKYEKDVRRMYPEKIPAEQQIEIINTELDTVQKLIKDKNIPTETSDTASENGSSDAGYSDSS